MRLPALLQAACLFLAAGCSSAPPAADAPAFDGAAAFSVLESQVAFGPRVPGTPAHSTCADYLLEKLSAHCDSAWIDRWRHVSASGDSLNLKNIRGVFNAGAHERVLLCAHWDSRPAADQDPLPENRERPIPGANDGASGVAVLVELARIFSEKPPAVGVDLVLFDGEDYGDFYSDRDVLLGSAHFAKENSGYAPLLGVLLDMVGDRNASFPYEGNSWHNLSADCRLVWETAERLGYGKVFVRQAGPSVIDDHIPLLRAGIRCLDIIQMGLPYWHTLGDTPDKCSPASLEAVGRTLEAVIYGLSSGR